MDRICQYSTIIFAGNVSVLLIVAITTDYWEYRGFRTDELIANLKKNYERLRLVFPSDTSSYFVVKYFWDPPPVKLSVFATTPVPKREKIVRNYTTVYYQPPALLVKKREDYYEYDPPTQYFDGVRNVTVPTTSPPVLKTRNLEDKLVLYIQYTNLFRECDILEAGVRVRLGLASLRRFRCFNFITHNRDRDYIERELPAVLYLERIGFTMSLICIAVSNISLVSGAYGLLTKSRLYILTASSAACASGIAMTVSIAIFHGKCHLIHRHEFLAGVELPFKKTVEQHRNFYYGWSFGLAWICVVLCFIHTWVWLVKAQDMPELCFPPRPKWFMFRRRRRRNRFAKRLLPPAARRHHRVADNVQTTPPILPRALHRPHHRYSTGSTGSISATTRLLAAAATHQNHPNNHILQHQGANGGLTISCTAATNLDYDLDRYSSIFDGRSETDTATFTMIPPTVPSVSLASLRAASEHNCLPCSRSLARTAATANGDLFRSGRGLDRQRAASTDDTTANDGAGPDHIVTKCRGLSKSAGNFLFLSRGYGLDKTEEYRILNRPPDEFKVLLRPSETLKAFSADALNFP